MDKQLVIKSNFLVEASYRLSAIEQKIILSLATTIKSTDKEFQKYFFNLGELGEMLGLKTNADYVYLRDVTRNLLSKVLTLKKEGSTLQTHWLESVEYFDNQGTVALSFNPELKPFLIQLKNNFTKYQLKYAIQLKSRFSIRIYELLKQFEKIGHRDFLLSELREHMGINSDEYPFYGNFKVKVLLVAQKELAAKTDLSFTFEEIKIGRGVGKLRFYIKTEDQKKAELAKADAEVVFPVQTEATELEKLTNMLPPMYRLQESLRKLLNTWLEKHGFDYVARNIEYANDGSNAVKPGVSLAKGSNYRAYLTKALNGDFGLPYKEDKEAKKQAEDAERLKAQAEQATRKFAQEQKQREQEYAESARIFRESLAPEALESLRQEALSNLDEAHRNLVIRKAPGSEMLLKLEMDKICLARMNLTQLKG